MATSWDTRIASFWESVDDFTHDQALDKMRVLLQERPSDDPDALYEWASVHDYLGMELEAVPLYEAALGAGLSGDRKPQAIIQLASSLRNVGRAADAALLLEDFPNGTITGDASQAFLALALRDSGRVDEALQVALTALARTLPLYGRTIARYAGEQVRAAAPAE